MRRRGAVGGRGGQRHARDAAGPGGRAGRLAAGGLRCRHGPAFTLRVQVLQNRDPSCTGKGAHLRVPRPLPRSQLAHTYVQAVEHTSTAECPAECTAMKAHAQGSCVAAHTAADPSSTCVRRGTLLMPALSLLNREPRTCFAWPAGRVRC